MYMYLTRYIVAKLEYEVPNYLLNIICWVSSYLESYKAIMDSLPNLIYV